MDRWISLAHGYRRRFVWMGLCGIVALLVACQPVQPEGTEEMPSGSATAQATEVATSVGTEALVETATPEATEAPAEAVDGGEAEPAVPTEQLANAAYAGIYDEPVQLTDGLYEGEPFVEGGAVRPTVMLIAEPIVYGDLNGDGTDDAAFFLTEHSGASGVFTYLAVVPGKGQTEPHIGPHPTMLLGDRVQIVELAIVDGQVEVDLVVSGPEDPACCPTLKVQNTYALTDGALAEVASEELGQVSLDDLMGTSWTLQSMNLDEPFETETQVTAEFRDGRVGGSSGCNSYNGPVMSDGGQNLTVGPIASTMMACPEPQMNIETQYLSALQHVTQWSYFRGGLAMTYQNEEGIIGTLVFAEMVGE